MMGWLVMALFDPNRTFQRSVVHIAIKLAAVATQKTLDKIVTSDCPDGVPFAVTAAATFHTIIY